MSGHLKEIVSQNGPAHFEEELGQAAVGSPGGPGPVLTAGASHQEGILLGVHCSEPQLHSSSRVLRVNYAEEMHHGCARLGRPLFVELLPKILAGPGSFSTVLWAGISLPSPSAAGAVIWVSQRCAGSCCMGLQQRTTRRSRGSCASLLTSLLHLALLPMSFQSFSVFFTSVCALIVHYQGGHAARVISQLRCILYYLIAYMLICEEKI